MNNPKVTLNKLGLSLYLRKGQSKGWLLEDMQLEQMTHSLSH